VKLTGKTESEEAYTSMSRPEYSSGEGKIPHDSSKGLKTSNGQSSVDDNIRIESHLDRDCNSVLVKQDGSPMDENIPEEPITENEIRDISSMQKNETKIESSGEVYIDDEFEESSKQ